MKLILIGLIMVSGALAGADELDEELAKIIPYGETGGACSTDSDCITEFVCVPKRDAEAIAPKQCVCLKDEGCSHGK